MHSYRKYKTWSEVSFRTPNISSLLSFTWPYNINNAHDIFLSVDDLKATWHVNAVNSAACHRLACVGSCQVFWWTGTFHPMVCTPLTSVHYITSTAFRFVWYLQIELIKGIAEIYSPHKIHTGMVYANLYVRRLLPRQVCKWKILRARTTILWRLPVN